MSTFRRKEKPGHSFSVKSGPAPRSESTADKNGTAIRKGTDAGKKPTLLEQKKGAPVIRRRGGFSGLLIWGGLIFLCVIAVGLMFDSAGEAYVLTYLNSLWQSAQPAEKYDPLPINENNQPGPPPEKNLVWIPGGWFWMGSNDAAHPDSTPTHKVYVDGLWMGKYEVTNAEWADFVKDTGYLTVAERKPDVSQLPADAKKEVKDAMKKQQPFSIVFTKPDGPVFLANHMQWWRMVEGADWKHPLGPDSNLEGKDNHPAVQVCYLDCEAYVKWKNYKHRQKGWLWRLPTEAEWEFAARGALHRTKFTWGDELQPDGKWLANIWQGKFPSENTQGDGYEHTAPVGSFPANGFGLHDMAGNVWEWCSDYYMTNYYANSPERNPGGPVMGFDPREPGLAKKVQRGGSFLCDASYCERYLTYARGKGEINSAQDHCGFRIVLAPEFGGH